MAGLTRPRASVEQHAPALITASYPDFFAVCGARLLELRLATVPEAQMPNRDVLNDHLFKLRARDQAPHVDPGERLRCYVRWAVCLLVPTLLVPTES